MSSNYTANQFDHAFKPILLGNYQYGTNPWPGRFAMCSPTKPRGTLTPFIADDCGHLLPEISRNACTSPWGDYGTMIWEQTAPCHTSYAMPRKCINLRRHPERFDECGCPVQAPKKPRVRRFPKVPKDMEVGPAGGCCRGLGLLNPMYGKPVMMGDAKTVTKALRDQRRAEKAALLCGRGGSKGPPPGSDLITFHILQGPGNFGPSREECI